VPKGPRGEKRPADVIGAAVWVARISLGDESDDREDAPTPSPAQQLESWVARPGRRSCQQNSERRLLRRRRQKDGATAKRVMDIADHAPDPGGFFRHSIYSPDLHLLTGT
jgi:hypothetical protein